MGRIMLATSNNTDEEYGGNIETQTESDYITRVGNYIVSETSKVKKYGKVVTAEIGFTTNTSYDEIPAGGYTTIGTIPNEYKPNEIQQQYFGLMETDVTSADYKKYSFFVSIKIEGNNIQIYNYLTARRISLRAKFVWILD